MRKTAIIVLSVLAIVFLTACGGEKGLTAGSATGESLMKLLPESTQAVMVIDVGRASATTMAAKSLEDEQARKNYEEMVKATGIDLMKDVFFVVMGLTGPMSAKEPDTAFLVNLKYEKEALLELLRENTVELAEEDYSGITLYKGRSEGQTGPMSFGAFLDGSNILAGTEAAVKSVIDVYQKRAASMTENENMARALKPVNTAAIAWGAVNIPSDLLGKAVADNPMLKAMEGITAVNMSFDYKNKNMVAEIRTMGGTKEQNANLASTLNGLKGMGAMMAAQEPVFGEALGGIEISSGEDYVRLFATLPEELLQKLQKTAQTKLGEMVQTEKEPSEEEKK
jgi:hypothetical protein